MPAIQTPHKKASADQKTLAHNSLAVWQLYTNVTLYACYTATLSRSYLQIKNSFPSSLCVFQSQASSCGVSLAHLAEKAHWFSVNDSVHSSNLSLSADLGSVPHVFVGSYRQLMDAC